MTVTLASNALCSVSDARRYTDVPDTGQHNDFYINAINAFSSLSERACNRAWPIAARTEYFDSSVFGGPGGGTASVFVKAPPIDTTATLNVYDDPARTFAASSLLTINTQYVVNATSGIITRVSGYYQTSAWTGATGGQDRFRAELAKALFSAGTQSIKVVYTGGLVLPRPGAPAVPVVTPTGTGFNGRYSWKIATVTNATSAESVPSDGVVLTLADQSTLVTFANPGAGYTTRIYRTKMDGSLYYLVTSVAGSAGGGNQTYTDTTVDDSLDVNSSPQEAGPVTVPEDLRWACMAQVADWFRKRANPGMTSVSGGASTGNVVFLRKEEAFLPQVKAIIQQYWRVGVNG